MSDRDQPKSPGSPNGKRNATGTGRKPAAGRTAQTAGGKPRGSFGKPSGRPYPAKSGAPRRDSSEQGERPAGNRTTYGKPAAPGAGGRSFGKPSGRPYPAKSGAPRRDSSEQGERSAGNRTTYGKPAAPGAGGCSFGKPSGRPYPAKSGAPGRDSSEQGVRPAGSHAPSGKPAAPGAGGRSFSKPSGRPSFAKGRSTTGAPRGNRPFRPAKPAEPQEHTDLSQGARRVALQVLGDVHENGAYAALALQKRLGAARLSPADRRLATSIVYATLEQQSQIDFALDRLMDHPTHEPVQRDILRLSACQILFHDRVPDSAAVNEGVTLARAMGMEGATGFLNAVLRNLVRSKGEIPWPKKEEDLRTYLHIMGSMPMWLVDKLLDTYGEETAEAIIMHRSQEHEMVARPNMMQLTDAQFELLLQQKAWRWRRGIAPHAYLLGGVSEVALDNDYRAGRFSLQGQSSILAAEAMQVAPGMRVLDACAAPGGKTCYMAETMQGTGRVFAWELHEKRAMLLEAAKHRLQLENVRISIRDAALPKPDFEGTMDAVLLDAPCTGLGVLTNKPDLKYRLQPEDVTAIVTQQQKLLNALSLFVKPGGVLVYSTCSILPEENVEQVKAFLESHPEFSIQFLPTSYPENLRALQTPYGLQLFAHRDEVEGFFIARLRRTGA